MRSLMYAWFYQVEAGVSDTPWDSEVVFTIASGDDTVMWIVARLSNNLVQSIEILTTRNTAV